MKNALTILAASLAITSLHAGPVSPAATFSPEPEGAGWSFRVAPYSWLTATDGDIGVGPLTVPVDISFSDTVSSLDMAYMFVAEVGYGRWSLTTDFIYGDFSNDVAGGGRVFKSFRYEYTQWVLTPTLGYQVIKREGYHMDLFAGARITSFDTTLTGRFVGGGQIQSSNDSTWVDPIVGVRGQAALGEDFFLRYNGDIGGFGASSDLVWQAFLGLGYNITDSVSLALGYRAMGVDYTSGAYTLDMVNHGPLLGVEFRF